MMRSFGIRMNGFQLNLKEEQKNSLLYTVNENSYYIRRGSIIKSTPIKLLEDEK